MKKTIVYCEVSNWTACKFNKNGKCTLPEIHLILSYGRSTDYTEEFMCRNREAGKNDKSKY